MYSKETHKYISIHTYIHIGGEDDDVEDGAEEKEGEEEEEEEGEKLNHNELL